MLDKLITYIWVGTIFCIRSCLLCEPVLLRVAIATSCDAVCSHNKLDLIQSLVPPHYVCNGYLLHRNYFLLINMLENGMLRVLLLANRKTVK